MHLSKKFVINFSSNQDRAIIFAPLRFSRQDESNDIRFDPASQLQNLPSGHVWVKVTQVTQVT